jgi:hypothetical protein
MQHGISGADELREHVPVGHADGDDLVVGERPQPDAGVPAEETVGAGHDHSHQSRLRSSRAANSGIVSSRSFVSSTESWSVFSDV